MKKYGPFFILPLVCIILWMVLPNGNSTHPEPVCTEIEEEELSIAPQARESITFIMNADKGGQLGYYSSATQYYRFHPEERTDYVVTHLRTLDQVREWLVMDKPANGLPWGTVNIVVHSNEWIGLAAPIFEGGMRANAERLELAAENGDFPAVPDSVLDTESQLIVHGCGLGRNTEMLHALSYAFGGRDASRPVVKSSRFFLHYATGGDAPSRYQIEPFYTFFRTGKRPGNRTLAKELAQQYPARQVNWGRGLAQKHPDAPGDPYHEEFVVPIVWTVAYPDKASRPDISTDSLKMDWMDMQPDLQVQIEEMGIPREHFEWEVLRVLQRMPDGRRLPAIKATGRCTVVTVLQAVTEPDIHAPSGEVPVIASLDDPEFYATVSPDAIASSENF